MCFYLAIFLALFFFTVFDYIGCLNWFNMGGVGITQKGSLSTLLGNDAHHTKEIKCGVSPTGASICAILILNSCR